ncbi:hypothetical protein Mgra_00002066, partial [Meloidogyne graminicola]
MEEDLLQDETLYFERNRIKLLKDERKDIQKKTFTKWCNTYLSRARMEIQDLFADLGDGIILLKFLEIISGESLGKPNKGRMRVQKIENINKSLEFLKQKKIQLENIGAEDIADGNEHLILGLIWTIILRFTIENIEIEAKESGERKHAKEALLLWCQRKTAGYPNVRIDNFSSSWRSANLNMAFDVAERKLDIARLLDAEDVNVACPDEKSTITYVSLFYHCFAKEKSELTGARRVAKVVGELVQLDQLQEDYEQLAADLLCWIHKKITELSDRNFPNLLNLLLELLALFSCFRKEEKPQNIERKEKNAGRRRSYIPPEGLGLHDIESAWRELEKAEHSRQGALINELQRQERLEFRAELFYKKADVRDAWLREMQLVLNQFECNECTQTIESDLRLLRNISAEAIPKTSRFSLLTELCNELQKENFHDIENICKREKDILSRWNKFLEMLSQKEAELGRLGELGILLGELEELGEELTELGEELGKLKKKDCKHFGEAELLQRLEFAENNICAKREWLIQLGKRAKHYSKNVTSKYGQNGTEQLAECLCEREQQLDYLQFELKQHRAALQRDKEFFQVLELCAEVDRIGESIPRTFDHFEVLRGELNEQLQANHECFQEFRELMVWARQMHATITGEFLPKDVAGCEELSIRHKEFKNEISIKEIEKQKVINKWEKMLKEGQDELLTEIRLRIGMLDEVFSDLFRTWHRRQKIYEYNYDLQKWLTTASELENWLIEREKLLSLDWKGIIQDGLEAIEYQIKQFDSLLISLDAKGPHFEALKKLTLLEEHWQRLKSKEDCEKIVAATARLQQQKQARERRKTQEIILMGGSAGVINYYPSLPSKSTTNTRNNSISTNFEYSDEESSLTSSSPSLVVIEEPKEEKIPIEPSIGSPILSIEILQQQQPTSTTTTTINTIQQSQPSVVVSSYPVGMRVQPNGKNSGFTTRRTQSIRRSHHWDDMRTVDIHGYLERKQELQPGGKKSTFRSWKNYYTILCGQLFCFFKDEHNFMENIAAAAPLALYGSYSALNPEYIKKRFVFRLHTADGAQFLFAAPDQLKALEWVDKLNFRARLDPADQLLAFRHSTSEPLGITQSRRSPFCSTTTDMLSISRSMTLKPRPKPKELNNNQKEYLNNNNWGENSDEFIVEENDLDNLNNQNN